MLIFTSCNQAEIERLEAEKMESIKTTGEKNVKINSLLEELNYIADNLQVIREKQGVYETLTVDNNSELELLQKPEDKIKAEIEMIDFLMSNNLDRIATLEKSLEESGDDMNEVKKLLSSFKMDVKDKGDEIQHLKERIVELLDNQIIRKKGGLLGLGAVNILKDDFNKEYFTSVDLRKLENIPVAGKQLEILTEHPKNSYEIVKDDQDLISEIKINNKDAFWEGSQYLVMVTK